MPAALRPNDLVRDTVNVWTTARRLASTHHVQLGHYVTVDTLAGVRVRRADFGQGPPWVVETQLTVDEDDTAPDVAYDPATNRLWVLWERGADILWASSTDFGATFEEPSVALANAGDPVLRYHPQTGAGIHAGYRAGNLVGKNRHPGSTAWSDEFTFLNASAVALAVEEQGFDLSFSLDQQGSLNLVVVIDGEAEQSVWRSTDLGQTWAEVTA